MLNAHQNSHEAPPLQYCNHMSACRVQCSIATKSREMTLIVVCTYRHTYVSAHTHNLIIVFLRLTLTLPFQPSKGEMILLLHFHLKVRAFLVLCCILPRHCVPEVVLLCSHTTSMGIEGHDYLLTWLCSFLAPDYHWKEKTSRHSVLH